MEGRKGGGLVNEKPPFSLLHLSSKGKNMWCDGEEVST